MKSRLSATFASIAVLFIASTWASADTYKLDPVHSQVIFQVSHMGVSKNFARFNTIEGTLVTDDDASKISLEAKVPVDSVDTNSAARDKHLKSPDFFDAKQFPDITFKSTSVKKNGDNYEITGDLTLHGVTKSITVTLNKIGEADAMNQHRVGFETQLVVKRSDYGMNFMVGPVGDDISLWINLEGIKQ